MNSISAFMMGNAHRDKELMVFDWDKAAQLIKENKPNEASAGLADDWEWTGGDIYRNGNPVTDSSTYLSFTWAKPQLDMDGNIVECYRMQSECPDWGCDTKWPESALHILIDPTQNKIE